MPRTSGVGRRVGLGLAVARGFAEAMGGILNAEDTPGGGLTMVLTLQAAPGRPPARPDAGHDDDVTAAPPHLCGRRTVAPAVCSAMVCRRDLGADLSDP